MKTVKKYNYNNLLVVSRDSFYKINFKIKITKVVQKYENYFLILECLIIMRCR